MTPPLLPPPKLSRLRVPKLALTVQFAAPAFIDHQTLLPHAVLARWIRSALFSEAELTVRFVDADEGRMLNRQYRGKNYPTNVLTFSYPADDPNQPKGGPLYSDLVLCCPVIEHEANAQHKPLLAHYAHLIVHGVLHAQGYNHENDRDARKMETLEIERLSLLGFPDPYHYSLSRPIHDSFAGDLENAGDIHSS